jgi:hypothetical protein
VLSEWTKLRTLRSTRYALLASVVLTIGIAIASGIVNGNRWNSMSHADQASFDPLARSLDGVTIGQLLIGVLGVLVITGEYSTGMIRSTFAAVPRRLPVLWAKAGVYGAVTLALALPSTLIAFFGAQAFLSGHTVNGHDISLSFSNAGVARAVIGGALYLTLIGLLGLGIGAILRNTAAGISALAAVLFVVPAITSLLPASWDNTISPYFPSTAGGAIMQVGHHANTLAPWTGLGVLAAYVAAILVAAAVLLRRRDV